MFTHFERAEDVATLRGKLEDELIRSEIARQIIRALTEAGIRIVFVAHLYDLAAGCHAGNTGGALFLRAQRRPGGERTFKLPEGESLPTSYGEDLYQQVFGTRYERARA